MVSSVTNGVTEKLSKKIIKLSKPNSMTIHRKALEKHFRMVPLIFRFKYFWVNAFSEFS
jgi:hypothetical protein